jgi:ribonuclease E
MTDDTDVADPDTTTTETTPVSRPEGDVPEGERPEGTTTGSTAGAKRRRHRGGRGRGGGAQRAARPGAQEGDVASAEEAGPAENAAPARGGDDDAAPSPKPKHRPAAGRKPAASRSAAARARSTAESARAGTAEPTDTESDTTDSAADESSETGGTSTGAPKKRRRRGHRGGRNRKRPGTTGGAEGERAISEATAEAVADVTGEDVLPKDTGPSTQRDDAQPDESPSTQPAPRPRRRRRGSGASSKAEPSTAPPSETASSAKAEPVRRPRGRASEKEVKEIVAAGGPTRGIRTTRPRTGRTGRVTTRRREPIPYVPRVTDKLMVITQHGERDQIAVLEGRDLVQHYVTRVGAQSMVGNVYLGRVQNVLPGMEAAFIDIGRGRNGVLYAGEVNFSPEDLDRGSRVPRIEQMLKTGQAVVVQVTKDPMGGKGARLTAQISMPGRYLVMVPNADVSGISRRLPDNERRRLKAIMKKIKPGPHGIIVRTAAEGASEEALTADLNRLVEEWDEIQKRTKKAKAPSVLYEEPELTVRVVRDLFNDEEFRELVTDSRRVYDQVMEYVNAIAPDLASKVRLHEGKLPVFEEFHIEEQIHKALDRKVWLPSGGYLIIERTEAMAIIDVNTGKSVGKTNLEETVVNTNLEAARETARQLRLRDIGGIIVIDFIDMLLEQNKRNVEDTMKEALAQDKTRSQVFEIGPLGLMQVTRKRVSGGLVESFSETCPTCEGRGIIISYES